MRIISVWRSFPGAYGRLRAKVRSGADEVRGQYIQFNGITETYLVTNGPNATIAEIVQNPLPRERRRLDIHKQADFYAVRNHLIDFLVERSKTFKDQRPAGYDHRHPPVVRPTAAPQPLRATLTIEAPPSPAALSHQFTTQPDSARP